MRNHGAGGLPGRHGDGGIGVVRAVSVDHEEVEFPVDGPLARVARLFGDRPEKTRGSSFTAKCGQIGALVQAGKVCLDARGDLTLRVSGGLEQLSARSGCRGYLYTFF